MKIVHLVPSLGLGGTEAVADLLDDLCRSHGHRSLVDLPFPRGEAPPASLGPLRWTRWALRPRDTDVFHAHLAWPDRLGAVLIAARTKPLVITVHLLPAEGAWPRDRVTGLDAARMLVLASRRPRTRFVVLSRHDRDRLAAIGVTARVVRNAPPRARAPSSTYRWPADGARLASIGRLHAQKGFDRMLRALAHPSIASRRWHWCVAGDGVERASLHALRDALGLRDRVDFPGSMPPAALFEGADLLLAPSRAEGMPLVPLEALEARVPVLASDIPPHRELFESAPSSLLPIEEARWPDALLRSMDPAGRDALLAEQRAVLGDDPRERFWRETFSCYEASR